MGGMYATLSVRFKLDNDSVSFKASDLDSIVIITNGYYRSRPDTQIWRYNMGNYDQIYPGFYGGSPNIYVEPPRYDSVAIQLKNGKSWMLNGYREKYKQSNNEFGCSGCPELQYQQLSVNSIYYNMMPDYRHPDAPVDLQNWQVVFKNK